MEIVAVANFKGGAGKTTTAGYLAAYIAQALGRLGTAGRVLLVDLDHQAHATRWALSREAFEELGHDLLPALIAGRPLAELVVPTLWAGVDLAPASVNLGPIELQMASLTMRETRLRKALAGLTGYEYAVIDCPPSGGVVMQNALAAAGWIVVPIEAGNFSLAGVSDFAQWVETMRAEGVHDARWLGLVPTRHDRRKVIAKDLIETLNEVSDALGGVAVLPAVPERTAQELMVKEHRVAAPRDIPDIARAYGYVADHVLRTVGGPLPQEAHHARSA